jgi:hypothetical protein
MAGDPDPPSVGAGSWSLLGFDYQVDVSVWIALDVMLAARMTSELTLEHVSQEDLEADMEELAPAAVADAIAMHGYRMIVQAKRRSGDAWTEARFLSLLNHGTRRTSAASRLAQDSNARYLLVTSAALNGPVRQLGVRHAGSWPAASKVPGKIAALSEGVAGRIAIVGGQDDERLCNDIKTLLLERFRVPRARWQACLSALRKAAWDRMRGEAGGKWSHDNVQHIIADHEGYLVGGLERQDYVKPTNWGDLTQALAKRHAVMIIGQSGSGKTATAEALWLDRKAAIPDLKRVHITRGPEQLRTDTTLPPVLYDIEDPWGRFKFEPGSRPWNDRLGPAFQSARHDRLFIATSRADVAQLSGAADSIQRWRMPLDAENYGHAERQALYRTLSQELPSELAAFVHEREAAVLQRLSLPLELRKFFDAVPNLDREDLAKNAAAAFAAAIDQAHRDSIERMVMEQIQARDAVKPAAILWCLIKPHGRLSIDVLRGLEDPLADSDPSLDDKLHHLVSSFITARNLRQGPDGSLTYAHGRVEAGIEATLAKHPQAVRRVLGQLVDVLLARDADAGGTWGVETAALIVQVSRRIVDATPQLARTSHDRIDAWLEQRLAAEERELPVTVSLAAAVGSSRSGVAEFARWLEHQPSPDFEGFLHWGKPERDEAWHTRLRADPEVRRLAEAFVRFALPTAQRRFPVTFARDLAEVVGDLTEAFLDAALASVECGIITNDDVLAAGALADLDGAEVLIDAAVATREPTAAELEQAARDHLQIINDEVPEDYADYLVDDDSITAATFLHAYVRRVRAERGWQALASHRHLSKLRSYWLLTLANGEGPKPQGDELVAAIDAAYGSEDEALLWTVLATAWDPRFASHLVERMVAGAPQQDIRRTALLCFRDHVAERMSQVLARLNGTGATGRLAQLACDLAAHAAHGALNSPQGRDATLHLVEMLPDAYRSLALAEIAILEDKQPAFPSEASIELLAICDAPPDVRVARLRLAQHVGIAAVEDVRHMLAHATERDDAVTAIEVAIRRDMKVEITGALDHRFAHVAARAITAVAETFPSPLPPEILARAERRSSPVRKALLALLAAKPHPAHLPALARLVGDEWSRWAQRENDDGNFPIARGAIEAITALDAVPDSLLDAFLERAKSTEDLVLMGRLLACVVRHGDEKRQAQVVAMARKGRRVVVGRAAAFALYDKRAHLKDATIARITEQMILRLPAMIADYLVLVVGLSGTAEAVNVIADALAASEDRRVFLALLARATRLRDVKQSAAIAARLPNGHPARLWSEGAEVAIDRTMLINLGDSSAVREAYAWMKPRTSSSG